MKPNILAPIILAASFGIFPFSACADTFHDIATQARARYAAAQTNWQWDLAELMIRTKPDFRELATLQRDTQTAYTEQGTARFQYLLDHDPSRIVLTNGLSQFANFEWTEADTKALAKLNPAYVVLQQKIATLEKRNDQQPDREKFRTWFRETFSQSSDYKKRLSDFQATQKEVEAMLSKYKPDP